jgi:pimeloyl-ACP methyl ester carboxylesterase
LLSDAIALFDFARQRHTRVSVIGQSLGSGVAVHVAAARQVGQLVLITPYDSIENVAKAHFPLFPVSLLIKEKYNAAARVGSINRPTLVLLAEQDEVIPRARSEALVNAFRATRPVVAVIPGSSHNSVCIEDDLCQKLLRDFL